MESFSYLVCVKLSLLHKDSTFKYENHLNKFELKGHTICSKAEIPGFHLHFWQPSGCQHLAVNGILSKVSAFRGLDSRLSLSPGMICLDLKRDVFAFLFWATSLLTQNRHGPKLLDTTTTATQWICRLQGCVSTAALIFLPLMNNLLTFHSPITIYWSYTIPQAIRTKRAGRDI